MLVNMNGRPLEIPSTGIWRGYNPSRNFASILRLEMMVRDAVDQHIHTGRNIITERDIHNPTYSALGNPVVGVFFGGTGMSNRTFAQTLGVALYAVCHDHPKIFTADDSNGIWTYEW